MKAATIIAGLLALTLADQAAARDQIRIVGSSTVFPFATTVAERFGKGGQFKAPIVESTGTGGGMALFCAGLGAEHPDIANASRKITDSERKACAANGVAEITEIKIGFDGIVIANSVSLPPLDATLDKLYLALAREVPNGEAGEGFKAVPTTTRNGATSIPGCPATASASTGRRPRRARATRSSTWSWSRAA
jgi:phosphate transport system substrate-binding protein